jgi:regulator of cell morphogenesis and NO signaling
MNISPDLLLAEIVDLVPGAPRVLESHGLDYCCGGQRTLNNACQLANIDPAAIIADLDGLDAGAGPDWVPLGPGLLVDHLEATHHAYLHAELPRLEALADKVAGVHGSNHPKLVELHRLCIALREDLEPHMAKEERVLFPMIRELSTAISPPSFHCGSVANPVSMMTREHEQTGRLLQAMRQLTDGYRVPDDACASYRALYEGLAALEADTHLHIHKENNVLFPAVLELEQRWSHAV